ncbi:MAG: polyprenyl synthetase family protein [Thermoflexales bacterium]|nr:polyprenyl synthetase family protein [Thermoflexales bacterium]MDW8352154.1 polyprenyl synthetase family protein [Anaerolineae bacterium]
MQRAHQLVRQQLADVEATLLRLPDLKPDDLRAAVERIVASGGKRIRPVITLLIAGMLGRLDNPRAVDLASAVEMLHTATLVHDDLIDGSLVRRGAATLNAVWTPAATVLTGDYLFAVAANLAARTESVRVMSIFADTLGVIVAGELQQQFTDFALRATRDDYYRRIYSKTASMFVLAATAAGVICDATEAQITALHDYGRDLGIAFQVMDDVLDFTGEQANVGKPVGSDLRRGLITLPVICYIEAHGRDDVECALRGECDPQTYDRIVAQIRASDAIACSLEEADAIAQNAKKALQIFPDNPYRATLIDLVDYTLERDK